MPLEGPQGANEKRNEVDIEISKRDDGVGQRDVKDQGPP
jgi:hypothetical protein